MTGSNYIFTSPVYRLYQQHLEAGSTTLSFLEWEEKYSVILLSNKRAGTITRNNRKHMAKIDDMKKRLRQKLEERKKNKSIN